ncbi:MAG: response regulator, partial [Desulfobacteraceae bacterium]|nr:response regulator [Desulfobacteraceae bacterium]
SNIKLNMQHEEYLPKVNADKNQIGQVISNVVSNARYAMPDGGHLYISLQNIILTENEQDPLKPGEYIKISIRDEGVGILPEHLDKIFDPYFSTKQTGSGMGLAASYSILQKHNGLITAASLVDHGATFSIFLPTVPEDELAESDVAEDKPCIDSAKILIMDDDNQVRNIAEKIIKKFGFEVGLASEGLQAVEMYEQALKTDAPFDLVLMDLTIPGGMGGKEAVQKVLSIDRKAKVIVISGYSNDPVLANFEEYGFKGMLEKPFKIEELKKIIEKTLI